MLNESKIALAALAMWALVLTFALGVITIKIETSYLNNHSYFYDSVSYSFYNARLYTRIADEGRFSLAAQEWLTNPKHPLRTLSLLLFAPELLAHPMGHLATALPMLFIFLLLLGWTVYRRTAHIPYALACMMLFCAAPILFDPVMGFGAFWLDLPASFLVGAAALCLLNSSGARNLKWLAGFAALAALATLGRYVAAVYTLVACAPVLAYYLVQRWRQENNFLRAVLIPVGLIAAIIAIIAGYFLGAHYKYNVKFYTTFAYNVGYGVWDATQFVFGSLLQSITATGIIFMAAIVIINVALFRRAFARERASLLISLWLAASVPLLLIFGIRDVGADHVTLYAVPLVFFAVVSPAPVVRDERARGWLALLACAFVLVAVAAVWHLAQKNYYVATHASAESRAQKEFDVALAEALNREGGALVWIAYFQEYAWIPSMETFYRYKKLPLPAGGGFFEDHEALWTGRYTNMSPREVSERVYAASTKWLDVAVVFDDPAQAEKNNWMDNAYSRAVAKYMAERIRTDANWRRAFVIESPRYGTLIGYRNLVSRGQGHDPALRRLAQITP